MNGVQNEGWEVDADNWSFVKMGIWIEWRFGELVRKWDVGDLGNLEGGTFWRLELAIWCVGSARVKLQLVWGSDRIRKK